MNETAIEWTNVTWNPNSGCVEIARECKYCYAYTLAEHKRDTKAFPNGFDITIRTHKLREPFRLKRPSFTFVNSMSDLFWEAIPEDFRNKVVDVIEATPQHQYQVLTKRPPKLLEYSRRRKLPRNFWAGVSIGTKRNTHFADILREVDATVRFISAEPILEPLDTLNLDGIHWLITGGESGVHLYIPDIREQRGLVDYAEKRWTPRPSRVPWVQDLRDRALAGAVAFFHKQWGGATPKAAGRQLVGKTWDELPFVALDRVDRSIETPLRTHHSVFKDVEI